VRVGNLAALDEENVETAMGPLDAYLIEARSVGGLSGSPVFLNLGTSRYKKGQQVTSHRGPIILLLGLIHGHFDVPFAQVVADAESLGLTPEKINTGIAIVTPASGAGSRRPVFMPPPSVR